MEATRRVRAACKWVTRGGGRGALVDVRLTEDPRVTRAGARAGLRTHTQAAVLAGLSTDGLSQLVPFQPMAFEQLQ